MDDASLLEYRYPIKKNGVLFMWATSPRLDFALKCIAAHGLHYRGIAFVWVKTRADGVPMRACGVRPSIVKPLTELVLAASYKRTGRPLPLDDEAVCQTIFAPRRKHSQKPNAVHMSIDRMYQNASKAEFFARERTPGWDCFGDELPLNSVLRQPTAETELGSGVNAEPT